MKVKYENIAILFLCILISSCGYNKEELPGPVELPANGVEITYTTHGKAVFDAHCISCHSPLGGSVAGVNLDTYTDVKLKADAGRIQVRLVDGSPSFMPTSGSLPQATKDTIQMWLDQGALQ